MEIDKIVTELNTSLKSSLQVKDIPCLFLGIADLLPYDELNRTVPVVMDKKEGEVCVFDDRYVLTAYHRLLSRPTPDGEGYGDAHFDSIIYKMLLVIQCDASKIKADRHRIMMISAGAVSQSINLNITGVDTSLCEMENLLVDSIALFNQEYRGFKYNLSPEHLLFGVQYSITTWYDPACVSICADC